MGQHETHESSGSGGGAAVAVVMIVVLLAVPCLVAVLLGAFFIVSSSRQQVVFTAPPAATVAKAAAATRITVVAIAADESLTIDGATIALDDLPNQLQKMQSAEFNSGSSLSVMVQSDPSIPFEGVQKVLTKIGESGVPYSLQAVSRMGGAVMMGVEGMETAPEMPALSPMVIEKDLPTDPEGAGQPGEASDSKAESQANETESPDGQQVDEATSSEPPASDSAAPNETR